MIAPDVDARTLRKKAQDAIKHHAETVGIDRERLETHYGWTVAALLAAFTAALEAGYCPNHGGPWPRDAAGAVILGELSVDRIDPALPPYWNANTRVICLDCNKREGPRTPTQRAVAIAQREAAARDVERAAARAGEPQLFDAASLAPGRVL